MKIERFTLKSEHLKLVSNFWIIYNECEYGAPGADGKRPYGNSDVEDDIINILGLKDENAYELARTLHDETTIALQIVVQNISKKVPLGIWECSDYHTWKYMGEMNENN